MVKRSAHLLTALMISSTLAGCGKQQSQAPLTPPQVVRVQPVASTAPTPPPTMLTYRYQTPPTPQPPTTPAPTQAAPQPQPRKPVMSAEVRRFIDQLGQIEQTRIQIVKYYQHVTDFDSETHGNIVDKTKMLHAEVDAWRQIVAGVDSMEVPDGCTNIQQNYRAGVNIEYSGMCQIAQIVDNTDWNNLDSIQKSLAALTWMKTNKDTNEKLDAYFSEADRLVAALCSKYSVAKSYEIKSR